MVRKIVLFALPVLMLIAGCSGGMDNSKQEMSEEKAVADMSSKAEEKSTWLNNQSSEKPRENVPTEASRMVIYNAELHLEVKNFIDAMKTVEEKVAEYGGYIVESSSNGLEDGARRGQVTIRVPEPSFQDFLHDAEQLAFKVTNRRVSGVDVTEEYVDLESRLKSKRVVEERLLDFMKEAKETEDLLKISADLAKVQEEIEQIVGRQKYLQNQSAFSTITVYLHENKVVVPSLENDNLNTWEKIKRQFATSINSLLAVFSGLAVLIIGNIPIILVLSMIVLPIVLFLRKRYKPDQRDNNQDQSSSS